MTYYNGEYYEYGSSKYNTTREHITKDGLEEKDIMQRALKNVEYKKYSKDENSNNKMHRHNLIRHIEEERNFMIHPYRSISQSEYIKNAYAQVVQSTLMYLVLSILILGAISLLFSLDFLSSFLPYCLLISIAIIMYFTFKELSKEQDEKMQEAYRYGILKGVTSPDLKTYNDVLSHLEYGNYSNYIAKFKKE